MRTRTARTIGAAWVVVIVGWIVGLAIVGGSVYVAVHFIKKFW